MLETKKNKGMHEDAPAGRRKGASLVPGLARPVRWS